MSGQPRSLPDQPNLRYLKLEAKRRLSAGEFAALHEAQLAIAREHGLSSWSALRQAIDARDSAAGVAITQLRWVISRFADADQPGWETPGPDELREHFTERFLSVIGADRLIRVLSGRAGQFRDELVVTSAQGSRVRAQAGDLHLEASAEPQAPYRLGGLRLVPAGGAVNDNRVAAPASHQAGEPPEAAAAVAAEAFEEFGLVGLVIAAGPDDYWTLARGWADLDAGEPLLTSHRLPAYSITKLITATAVLRLVADGAVSLDRPANHYLGAVRLADDAVTVRDLLAHCGGVSARFPLFAERVPDLAELAGPVLACDGQRGEYAYSNSGYAALGQLVADVTGQAYADAASRLVLEPLGMTSSFFPERWPDSVTDVATGHVLTGEGIFDAAPDLVCTVPAAGGLWATAADLVRFGASWASVLPADLAAEALTAQAGPTEGIRMGLGWRLNVASNLAGHTGGGGAGATSLVVVRDSGLVHVAMTNRSVPAEPVNARVMRAVGALG